MVNQVPAYLQQRQSKGINDRAVAGLGAAMPPHISIQGNSFTLIDAAGNESNEGGTLDVCIADVADVLGKRYYGDKPWTPDSNDAPICFSANGVGPSRDASQPQNAICATCPHNERGSAISKISNKPIKACRDEKWIAVIPGKYPTMLFQLVLTPGSFKNWRDFYAPFEKHGVDLSDTMVHISFEPKVNGVLLFAPLTDQQGGVVWIDENVFKAREAALGSKATDLLVGRLDVPIQAALAAPQQVQQIEQVPASTAPAIPPQTAFGGAPAAEQPAPRGRRRNTAQAPAETTQPAPNGFGGQSAQQAPFMPATAPAPATAPFGMAQGSAPDAALTTTLDNLFGKK